MSTRAQAFIIACLIGIYLNTFITAFHLGETP